MQINSLPLPIQYTFFFSTFHVCPLQIEEQIESMFNSKKRVKDLSAPGAASGPAGSVTSAGGATGGPPGVGPTSAGNIQKLEMAKRLALKINAQKNLGAEAQVLQSLSCSHFLFSTCFTSCFFSFSNMDQTKTNCLFPP